MGRQLQNRVAGHFTWVSGGSGNSDVTGVLLKALLIIPDHLGLRPCRGQARRPPNPLSNMKKTSTAEAAVQLYIQGVAKGDTAALEAAFHTDALVFGALGDQRVDIPVADMIAMLAQQPADVDGSFGATIRSLEVYGDVAVATVVEENFWGTVSFTDVFSLACFDGDWKIVNKAFTHTGGTPPAA